MINLELREIQQFANRCVRALCHSPLFQNNFLHLDTSLTYTSECSSVDADCGKGEKMY